MTNLKSQVLGLMLLALSIPAYATTLEPSIQEFIGVLAASKSTPVYKLPVPGARDVLEKAQSGDVDK